METTQDLKALQGFIDETNESLQDVENAILSLESDPTNQDLINTIFRPVHSMKGNSGFFGLSNINKFSHRMENLLDYIRNGQVILNMQVTEILLTGIDYLRNMLDRVEADPGDVALKKEEEKFLTEKVEQCKPEIVAVGADTVLEFEEKLKKGTDIGIDVHDDSFLKNIFSDIKKGNEYLDKLIAELEEFNVADDFDPDLDYSYESNDYSEQIQPIGEILTCLSSKTPIDSDLMIRFASSFTAIKRVLAGNDQATTLLDEIESSAPFFDDQLLITNNKFNRNCRKSLAGLIDLFQPGTDEQSQAMKVGEILLEQNKISEKQLSKALDKQHMVGEILVEQEAVNRDDLNKALAVQQKKKTDKALQKKSAEAQGATGKTLRIDQSRLDTFANSIGDLYINIESFNYLERQFREEELPADSMARFSQTVTSLDEMVKKLQDSVMDIRRVPVKFLFQRFPRVIRELSSSLTKVINFTLTGEDTIIDKDLLEKIENPMVHLLRNAVDHGIETPEERLAAGKPECGELELAATSDENYVYLTITDDGSGIQPKKMKKVALTKGFLTETEAEHLSDKELINLIFKPGFSSAEKVSDVSGRGVGMDVVMSALLETNGEIIVESEEGHGTTLRVTIPQTKTLVTKDALIAESAGQQFAILSEDITMTQYPEDGFVNLLTGEGGISFDNEVLRVIDLAHFFFAHPRVQLNSVTEKVLVICQKHGVALLIDQAFNHQHIVVKEFASGYKQFQNIPGVKGYTCLGSDEVVLVTDIRKMAKESADDLMSLRKPSKDKSKKAVRE